MSVTIDEPTVKAVFESFMTLERAAYRHNDPTVATAFEEIVDLVRRATLGPDHLALLARVVGRFETVRDVGRGVSTTWGSRG